MEPGGIGMTHQRMKRHARTRPDSGRLLWVGDDADWARMRAKPGPTLVCPQAGCGDELHAVCNRHGTRFLRRAAQRSGGAGRGACPHWWTASGATGPESARHLWLKARLASICVDLGWAAVPEDPHTHADIWLPDARTALEVQLRRTDTLGRTCARQAAGADTTVWFLAADVPAAMSLFRAPAVRFAVVGPDGAACVPWDTAVPAARLFVYGTVWQWQDWRLTTGRMSAYTFLAQLLTGQMGWCPPGTPGLPPGRGGWVRWTDLAKALHVPERDWTGLRSALSGASGDWIGAQLERRRGRR